MTTVLQPRAERLDLSFPVVFHDGAVEITGHCLNLSASGLLATFAQPLDLWTTGGVTLSAPGLQATLRARVARCEGSQAGLAFCFEAQAERVFIHELLALATNKTGLVGRPPF